MSLGCPQCGATAPPGAQHGTVYQCRACGNPVLPREAPDPVASPGAPPPAGPRHRSPWRIVSVALVVLAAAHLGLWALLTAEARRERAALVKIHGDEMLSARDPGAPPPAEDAKAWTAYKPASDLWRARVRCEDFSSRTVMLGAALGVSLAAQATFLVYMAIKWQRSSQRPPAPASRAPASPASPGPGP